MHDSVPVHQHVVLYYYSHSVEIEQHTREDVGNKVLTNMEESLYRTRYASAMKKLRDYEEEQDEGFIVLHARLYGQLKEEITPWNDRKATFLRNGHVLQVNVAWVVQKIAELEKLKDYNVFRPNQLEALFKDDVVKERLGNL